MKGGPFNYVGGLRPKRYFYNLSHSNLFDCDLGQLIPALFIDCVPGDRFKISNSVVIRTQPLFSPILQDVKVYTEYFFVPYRILWDDFQNFITGGKDGDFSAEIPLWNNVTSSSTSGQREFDKGSLADKFGLPVNQEIPFADFPIAFYQLAYNKIFNEYYRDETIDDEVDLFNNNVLRRRWKKDYFTAALPFQQRGNGAGFSLDLVSTDPDKYIGDSYYRSNTYDVGSWVNYGSATSPVSFGGISSSFPVGFRFSGNTDIDGLRAGVSRLKTDVSPNVNFDYYLSTKYNNSLKVGINGDTSNNIIDISQLRLSFQIQKFLERNARAGYRFNEFLLSHFGISPRDSVLQRPEYIGGSRSHLLVSEVLQTSETTDSSPQGNLAGRGIGVSGDYINNYMCSEFGCIIGLFSVMPTNLYDSQGIDKSFSKRSKYDFYFPEFAHLSEQPVKNKELYCSDDSIVNNATFGFQPIYQEYRHRRSYVTGEFRAADGIYKEYTFARSFADTPTLSSDFLESNPDSSRIFAVNSLNPLLVNFGNVVKSARPITIYSDPGLVDHF